MKLNFKQIFYVVFLTVTILSAKEFDLFIKNGRVMDGTGNPWFYADVGINGRDAYVALYWVILGKHHGPKASSLMAEMEKSVFLALL